MSRAQRALPWDSERGGRVWTQKPAAEKAALLAQTDALLLAAQGLKVQADGSAQTAQLWRKPARCSTAARLRRRIRTAHRTWREIGGRR